MFFCSQFRIFNTWLRDNESSPPSTSDMNNMTVNFESERRNAIQELKGVIGNECSENFSPTLRAKLVDYDEWHDVCTMEVIKSPYTSMKTMGSLNEDRVGERYTAPASRIWNAFFF